MTRLPHYTVEPSPWPLTSAMSAMFMALGLINWLHLNSVTMLYMGTLMMALSMFQWWRDIIREATFMGKHTSYVQKTLKLGMVLFIISEVCFFSAFFWAFFHSSLTPTMEIGCTWPPIGIYSINPMSVPLLNTTILLSSGLTVTWAHHCLMSKNKNKATISLTITILLGLYFTMLQVMEYIEAQFTISDSVYGSVFFIATGFHGAHVMIGTFFLTINLFRIMKTHFSSNHYISFELAAWYWHFVDVVWICLYVSIYWWGSL